MLTQYAVLNEFLMNCVLKQLNKLLFLMNVKVSMDLFVINYTKRNINNIIFHNNENKKSSENLYGISIDCSNRKISCSHGNESCFYTHM